MGSNPSHDDEDEFVYKDYEREKPFTSKLGTKHYEQTPLVTTLQRPIDIKPHIDGEYLRSKFPHPNLPLKSDHVDALLAECLGYMDQKASQRTLSCEYEVPVLKYGLPLYNRKSAVFALYGRLKERPGITVYGKPDKPYTLFISWA